MTKQLCVGYIKCIKPSSVFPSSTINSLKKINVTLSGDAQSKVTSTGIAGGILVKVTGIKGQDIDGKLIVTVVEGLDKLFSNKDDLYVEINDKKVWPKNKKFQVVKSQTKINSPTLFPTLLDRDVTITLFDHDRVSENDVVADLTIFPQITPNVYTYVVAKESTKSIYEIQFTVTDD